LALHGIKSPPAEKAAATAVLERLEKLQAQQNAAERAAAQKQVAAEENRIAENASGRAQYASTMETRLLKQYMDATVRVGGTKNTTLTIEYVLMNRPLVYNLITDATIRDAIGRQGFKVVVLTDGYDHTWRFAVSKTGWKPM
jgi:hypothetical protein